MEKTKVITGKVRFAYVHAFEAHSMEEGGKAKYSVCIIIPKSDKKTIAKIKKAIDNAYKEGKAKFGGKLPKSWKNPLRDGDEERDELEEFENSYFLNANSVRRPGVVDSELDDIIDKEEFYSGCYGRASVNFYAFNTSGNKGVAAGLENLQKLEDGEPLAGVGASAADDFGDLEDEDDIL